MSPIFFAFLAAFFVMLVSLAGVVFTFQAIGVWMRRHLTFLATFAAGVLIVLAYHLIEEALHEGDSVALIAASVIAGAVILECIHHVLPDGEHHHHDVPMGHAHTAVAGRRIPFSHPVHNVTDGFIIVPAFLIDWKIGLAATAGILLHELVQEVSEFFILKEAGYSTKKALSLNFLASSTILVGVALAFIFASFEGILAFLAGLAAGGFLSVVLRDLLPHAIHSVKTHGRGIVHATAAVLGALVMFSVITLVPLEEREEENSENAKSVLVADRPINS